MNKSGRGVTEEEKKKEERERIEKCKKLKWKEVIE